MKKGSIVVALCAAVATLVFAGAATAGSGNSANAKKCQKTGWQNWVRADQTPFASETACTSYAAKGGTLTVPAPPKSASQILCESYGGTFGASTDTALWTCNGWPQPTLDATFIDHFFALLQECDSGSMSSVSGGFVGGLLAVNTTCER